MHALRACCGLSSVALGTYAVTHIPLANAQAIAMANGVFAVALAAVFLREKVGPSDLFAGTICLAGCTATTKVPLSFRRSTRHGRTSLTGYSMLATSSAPTSPRRACGRSRGTA